MLKLVGQKAEEGSGRQVCTASITSPSHLSPINNHSPIAAKKSCFGERTNNTNMQNKMGAGACEMDGGGGGGPRRREKEVEE